jgi:hypothetical protein
MEEDEAKELIERCRNGQRGRPARPNVWLYPSTHVAAVVPLAIIIGLEPLDVAGVIGHGSRSGASSLRPSAPKQYMHARLGPTVTVIEDPDGRVIFMRVVLTGPSFGGSLTDVCSPRSLGVLPAACRRSLADEGLGVPMSIHEDQAVQVGASTRSVVETARDAGVDVARTAKIEAAHVAQEASDQAHRAATDVKQRVREEADRQHRNIADRVGAFAEELYTMAGERPQTPARELVAMLAARSSAFAEYLNKNGPEAAMRELELRPTPPGHVHHRRCRGGLHGWTPGQGCPRSARAARRDRAGNPGC